VRQNSSARGPDSLTAFFLWTIRPFFLRLRRDTFRSYRLERLWLGVQRGADKLVETLLGLLLAVLIIRRLGLGLG
jgi:hypothetical protein